eukprot:1159619-Pelagomonas_calceolata.AAC.14
MPGHGTMGAAAAAAAAESTATAAGSTATARHHLPAATSCWDGSPHEKLYSVPWACTSFNASAPCLHVSSFWTFTASCMICS